MERRAVGDGNVTAVPVDDRRPVEYPAVDDVPGWQSALSERFLVEPHTEYRHLRAGQCGTAQSGYDIFEVPGGGQGGVAQRCGIPDRMQVGVPQPGNDVFAGELAGWTITAEFLLASDGADPPLDDQNRVSPRAGSRAHPRRGE